MKPTIYETIINQIVEAIEAGAEAYRMPWHPRGQDITSPRNAVTGRAYRGVNVLALWALAEARGYGSGTWATYQQWQERGAQVRKGEKAASVVFWKQLDGKGEAGAEAGAAEDAHDPEQRGRFVERGYSVFNAEQVEAMSRPPCRN
jgi:antirestriction protein ArdC